MAELTGHQIKKKRRGICITRYCMKTARKGSNYCHGCEGRRWRNKNPLKASYKDLKQNAKRRGKEFDLTFEEFKEFASMAEYRDRGITRTSYHLDRIDETKGYTKDNLRYLENHLNVKKYRNFYNGANRVTTVIEKPKEEDNEDLPF